MSEPEPVTADVLRGFPPPRVEHDANKNSRGRLLIAGGSSMSPGAVMLSAMAAFRSGAGKVMLSVPRTLATSIAVAFPEAGVHELDCDAAGDPELPAAATQLRTQFAHVDALLIGPGLAQRMRAQQLTSLVLAMPDAPPAVIDAMALTGLWKRPPRLQEHHPTAVITPHAGEMSLLMGLPQTDIEQHPQRFAEEAARHLGVIVALKGPSTVIAQPAGATYLHEGHLPGLATSGSGDVLAGLIGSLMAQGAPVLTATLWGVFLHAGAGRSLEQRVGPVGFLARELPGEIPQLMQQLAVT